jgi:tetratricopeptide (TPR) repeat protein
MPTTKLLPLPLFTLELITIAVYFGMPSWAIFRARSPILTRRLPPVGYANEFDPDYAVAHANRGLLRYQQLGDIPGALTDLNLAILLDPRDASTYTTRGLIKYAELGDIEYALADYDLAITSGRLRQRDRPEFCPCL